jgi:hypothetical protein
MPCAAGDVPGNDTCSTAFEAFNGPNFGDNTGASTTIVNSCGSSSGNNSDIWWFYTVPISGEFQFDTNGSALGDTVLSAWDDCGGNEIACDDDGGDGLKSLFVLTLDAGTTVWLSVSDWDTTVSQAGVRLNVTKLSVPGACCFQDGTCEELLPADCDEAGGTALGGPCDPSPCVAMGACCLPVGACVELSEDQCASDGGAYEGPGTFCADVTCPQPDAACCFSDDSCQFVMEAACDEGGGLWLGFGSSCDPNPCSMSPNDACADAIAITPSLGSVFGETCLGSDDDTGFCGTSSPNQGIWYTVEGTGNVLTASTCNPGSNFDTKIQVFCGTCDELQCVGGNDDATGAPPECSLEGFNRLSKVEWCSAPGTTYYVYVGGFGTTCGTFELTVEEGGPCDDPPSCVAPEGRCCFIDCYGDTNGDLMVNVDDLVAVILAWGPCDGEPCPADIDGSGVVDVDDLVEGVILSWGVCDELSCDVTTAGQCDALGGVWDEGLTCDDPCPPPSGACCFPDGSCDELDEVNCAESGGDWQGPLTRCSPNPCPQPDVACCLADGQCLFVIAADCDEAGGIALGFGSSCDPNPCFIPPNDACADAMPITVGAGTVFGETCLASDDDTGFCGTSSPNQGIWYAIQGDGSVFVASTCNPGSDFDTKIQVFCGTCDGLICVGGNDDAPGGLPECSNTPLLSIVEWCSEPDRIYYIYVGGFGSVCGTFELTVTEAGPCAEPPPCDP